MQRVRPALAAIAALVVSGCASMPTCGAGLRPASRIDLYFGLNIPGGGSVSAQEWRRFSDTVLAVAFPDGFTVADAFGTWRSPKTNEIGHEGARVVTAIYGSLAAAQKVASVYRAQFRQETVGITQMNVCAAF